MRMFSPLEVDMGIASGELYHYGVKGMKWGVINEEETSGKNRSERTVYNTPLSKQEQKTVDAMLDYRKKFNQLKKDKIRYQNGKINKAKMDASYAACQKAWKEKQDSIAEYKEKTGNPSVSWMLTFVYPENEIFAEWYEKRPLPPEDEEKKPVDAGDLFTVPEDAGDLFTAAESSSNKGLLNALRGVAKKKINSVGTSRNFVPVENSKDLFTAGDTKKTTYSTKKVGNVSEAAKDTKKKTKYTTKKVGNVSSTAADDFDLGGWDTITDGKAKK